MDKDVLFLVNTDTIEFSEANNVEASWVHALPLGEYVHPLFGKMSFDTTKVKAFADSVKTKIRGIDPSINKMHGTSGGDGPAAGWVKDAEARPDGLWVFVEWVKDVAQEIKDKKWRYFSAEFQDKWTDATGKVHENVFFGGALTNRPYMKNLLPVNLSESAVAGALELSELITKGKEILEKETHKEEDVDLKKFTELLGLPDSTTEAELLAKLAELKAPANNDDNKKVRPEVPKVSISEDLRKLSEENPMVKALIETVDAQHKAIAEHNLALREADVDRRLSEFDKSKIVLTPKAKDLVHDLAMDMPIELTDRFWELLETMRNSSSMMVELGERAGTSVRYGRSKDAVSMFMDEANRIASDSGGKIQLSEAMEKVARENPKLYNDYRIASTSFRD